MRITAVLPLVLILASTTLGQAPEQTPLERVLAAAGPNRVQLEKALAAAGARRPAMRHLILGMPTADARSLGADRLLETLRLADVARAEANLKRIDDICIFGCKAEDQLEAAIADWRAKNGA